MHITWTSYAVRETAPQARAFYEAIGVHFTANDDGSFSHGSNGQLRLGIYPATGSYPSCAERPLPTEHAVIIRSQST